MINECIEKLKEIKGSIKEEIFKNFVLDGVYVLINKDFEIEYFYYDKDDKEIEKDDIYLKLSKYEYYSTLISLDKPLDKTKQIHSCNYLSFFVKIDTSKSFISDSIREYCNACRYPEKRYNKEKLKMYLEFKDILDSVDYIKIDKIQKFIDENIHTFSDGISKKYKGYLKIFFEDEESVYEREYMRYLIPNIFLNNAYNENLSDYDINGKDEIIGVPNENITFNLKKPFLENKGRKLKKNTYLNLEQALERKEFFDYLSVIFNNKYKYIYFSDTEIIPCKITDYIEKEFSGFYIKLAMGKKEKLISDYYHIPYMNLSKTIKIHDCLKNNADIFDYDKEHTYIEILEQLKKSLNTTTYSLMEEPYAYNNILSEPIILRLREVLIQIYRKGQSIKLLEPLLIPIIKRIIAYYPSFTAEQKSCPLFNLKMALEEI